MLQDEYDTLDNKIYNLKNKRDDFEKKLKNTFNEDDIIEYKFQIMKINEELPSLEKKLAILSKKINQEREKREHEEKENLRKDKLYKKLYVTLKNKDLYNFKRILNMQECSKDEIINELVCIFSSEQEFLDFKKLFKYLSLSEEKKVSNQLKSQKIPVSQIIKNYDGYDDKIKSKLKKTVEYIEGEYDLDFESRNGNLLYFKTELYDAGFKGMTESDYIDAEIACEDLKNDLYSDPKIWDGFDFEIIFTDAMYYGEFIEMVRETQKMEMQAKANLEFENLIKNREMRREKFNRYEELIDIKKAEKKSKIANNELTENFSIEDIANDYCKKNGFNNWKYDEKNSKKIIFEKLINNGKNISKMRKMEVRKLKKWTIDEK